ncbi:MAG: GNAT family N-acetyltransferase [Microbacterium sp.]|nr:MAG: GNAT family N-acetyltransferase [Microbacterium sp.]
MYATSPAESVHALDVDALTAPSITFFTARDDGLLLGCGALREIDPTHAEIKSMRTTAAARGRGVADAVLARMTQVATGRGYTRLSLETGVEDYFAAARRLYLRNGFVDCEPFGDYRPDRHSVFLTKDL